MRIPGIGISLRTRLTLWYGALLAVTLRGFSGHVYFTLERNLSSSVDEALRRRAARDGELRVVGRDEAQPHGGAHHVLHHRHQGRQRRAQQGRHAERRAPHGVQRLHVAALAVAHHH
jgi:hypothetical protein